MSRTIEYRGYTGSVEFSAGDELYYGRVKGISPVLSYTGGEMDELIRTFHCVVDDYLARRPPAEKPPEQAECLQVRLTPGLLRCLTDYAAARQLPLNSVIEEAAEEYLAAHR